MVVALKSRTIAPADAVAQSLAAWRWLQGAGARQCYFKYCSTFDSTPEGNIGPVAEALMDAHRAPTSRSPARPSPRTAERSTAGTCSSATSSSASPACGTIRSRR